MIGRNPDYVPRDNSNDQKVVITGISIPVTDMVILIFKFFIASVPAAMAAWVVAIVALAVFGGFAK